MAAMIFFHSDIQSATLTISGITIENGVYLGLDAGVHNYVAEAAGYQSKSGSITLVNAGPDDEPTELYITFKQTTTPASLNLPFIGILAAVLLLLLVFARSK